MAKRFLFQSAMFFLLLIFANNFVKAQQWGLYTLYATKNGTQAYLVDTNGTNYKTWTFSSTEKNAYSTYLIPGDTLVRTTTYSVSGSPGAGGETGKIQKVTWDGTTVWSYTYSSTTTQMHHDICPMPNGNVMFISYDVKSATQATQAGSSTASTFWSEKLVEVKPTGPTSGTVVWEWKLWDHMCQNYNSAKDNYVTSIVNNPQLLNINYAGSGNLPDRYHMNGIDYNEELDQIVVSIHFMNSVFVIDHSTTTAVAAGHTGGNSGKGGDFLYRWGNPASYGATGTTIFNVIHDAHWVSSDNPNYPDYLAAYNNKGGTGGKTAVDVWNPPYNGSNYSLTLGQAYTPSTYAYQYNSSFLSQNEGNSQQLPNGNMLVNNSFGSVYEINSAGTQLWTKAGTQSSHAYRFTKCEIRGPIVSASASSYTVCDGDQVTLNSSAVSVTETSPTYTYFWSSGQNTQSPIVTPNTTTTYSVTITNTAIGCSDTSSLTINVNPLPAIPVITLTLNTLNSTVANSYQWYFDGYPIPGANSQTYDPTADGQYQVEITDANGCSSISSVFNYSGTEIINISDKNDIIIYPNPTTGIINIEYQIKDEVNVIIIVYDICGNIVFQSGYLKSINLSGFENGIYYLSVTTSGVKILSNKIILIK
ncbi:MAG: aryl-sulfate sulfotransferase [Bacteroidota bacterium]